jgi:DNA/RNA-binding domain of Phe-tRNA-synthetase-like protein
MLPIRTDDHPLLRLTAFITSFPHPLGDLSSPDWLISLLSADARAPVSRDEAVRAAVRALLRHGGYRPSGRGKPASEYLVRAAEQGILESINVAVDVCNAVSLHSGLPMSVIDLDRAPPPFRVGVAEEGESYVFNASGQTIDLKGLLCLFDGHGPCANAVKDAQRTKTHPGTRRTLSLVWGCAGQEGRLERTVSWYRELLARTGAQSELAPTSAEGCPPAAEAHP